ncbi:MAG: hypothetical protein ABI120_05505 [Gemmatimonadaceae bacterium]
MSVEKSRLNRQRAGTCVAVVTLVLAAACDRTVQRPGGDSGVGVVPSAANDSLRPPVGTGWEADAGPFLVLPTVDGGQDAGSLLRPDATDQNVGDTVGLALTPTSNRLQLFSRGGLLGEATLSVERASGLDSGCTAWPIARLGGMARPQLAPGSGVVTPGASSTANTSHWTAAFVKGRITQLPLDSIEGLSPKDSAKMAVNIARLASGLSDDSVATFRGLPFVVLRAFRGKLGARSFIVTTLVRRVNQEDSPMEERLVMVIDGDEVTPSGWTVGWHERASGREDELVVSEPLLAFQVPASSRPHLLFGRDDGESLSAAMLVRDGAAWRVLWESALAGCDR